MALTMLELSTPNSLNIRFTYGPVTGQKKLLYNIEYTKFILI